MAGWLGGVKRTSGWVSNHGSDFVRLYTPGRSKSGIHTVTQSESNASRRGVVGLRGRGRGYIRGLANLPKAAVAGYTNPTMVIVDTHAHIYSPDEQKYPPIDQPLRPPRGKASLEDLQRVARENGARGVCAIQTSTFYRFDNRYICDSSKANPDWIAGVCTLDPDDPHSPGLLRQYVREYGLRGMRSIPARDGRLVHPGVEALWETGLELGIVINLLCGRNSADQAEVMLGKFPELRVVLDHCLNLKAGPELETTLGIVVRLSRFKKLHAKLTFIPTGSVGGYPCEDMHNACMRVVDAFGPERCVWGSDFPNHLWTPKVSYAEHLRIFVRDLPLSDSTRAEILGGTANRLWFEGRLN